MTARKKKTSTTEKVCIFMLLDSNVLLHCLPFDQINWLKLVKRQMDCDELVLYFPYALVSEIDSKQWNGTKRAQERARKIRPLILKNTKSNDFVTLKTNLRTFLDFGAPADFPFTQYNLNQQSIDDQLLASIILKREHGNSVLIVTADAGMNIKAQLHEIPVLVPPEEIIIPADDEDEKKQRELQKQIAELKSASSSVEVRFTSEKRVEKSILQSLKNRGTLTDYINEIKEKNPTAGIYNNPFHDRQDLLNFNSDIARPCPEFS
ncbi:MAG: PIN domain-containing protein [Candidatus Melainabacteria bacterium]|nr:PIN domain-containing protein [Candidatus Melainabacteria bacterium]